MSQSELTGQSLFKPTQRTQYQEVLSCCGLIFSCYQHGKTASNCAAAESHAKTILSHASLLLGELPAYLASDSEYFTRCFVKAIYLWLRLPESAGRVHVDTIGSETMALYPVDMVLTSDDLLLVDKALVNMGIAQSMLSEIKCAVNVQISNSKLKRYIADFLTVELQSSKSNLDVMRQCYGAINLPEAMVDVIVTDAQVFFCVPYNEDGLIESHKYHWNEQQNSDFLAFVDSLCLESATERIYFPSVGAFDKAVVSQQLLDDLTCYIQQQGEEYRNLKSQIVLDTLATMMMLIASQESEKFLIHDAWGHSWQETLCDFEWLYVKLGELREPLSMVTPSIFSNADNGSLIDVVKRNKQGEVQVNKAKLDHWIQGDLQGRVSVALNACIAELTADLSEYKFSAIAKKHGLEFPSSSLLESQPVRLDLTFSDALKHTNSLVFPYIQLIKSDQVQEVVRAELGEAGFSETESDVVLRYVVEHVSVRYGALMSTPTNAFSELRNPEYISLFERLQLNVCSIYCSLSHYLKGELFGDSVDESGVSQGIEMDGCASERYPELSMDFVMLAMACFFEEDRSNNVWHLDEILSAPLGSLIHAFGEEWRKVYQQQ